MEGRKSVPSNDCVTSRKRRLSLKVRDTTCLLAVPPPPWAGATSSGFRVNETSKGKKVYDHAHLAKVIVHVSVYFGEKRLFFNRG